MSTTETRTENLPSMLNRHGVEIEATVAQPRARLEAERKEIESRLAEVDRKVSLRSQMHASPVGMYATGTLPQ